MPAVDDLSQFTGFAPIFPLPNVVLFPHMSLPLHIFEERYRKLLADTLTTGGWLAMALLKPGWEPHYLGRPEIHEMVCLGRIAAAEKLVTGRYNIVLTGLQRAVVVQEQSDQLPYRTAQLELYQDFYHRTPTIRRDHRKQELLQHYRQLFPTSHSDGLFSQVLATDISLGVVCDLLGSSLPFEPHVKQTLLEEVDVDLRSEILLAELRKLLGTTATSSRYREFPPQFSQN